MEGWQLVIVITGIMTLYLMCRYALYKWDKESERADHAEDITQILGMTMLHYMELKDCEWPLYDLDTYKAAMELAFEEYGMTIQPDELPVGDWPKQGA